MDNQEFTIIGHVIDRQTQQSVPGLRVEAWDKDLIFHDLVGSAVTDQQGRFSMSFSSDYFSEIFFDRRPDLFFKVFQGKKQIRDAEAPFISNMQPGKKEIIIEVDLSPVEEPKEFLLRGVVRDESGAVQSGLIIRAFDRDLRSEESLGETVTDQNGRYVIRYTADRFTRAEKATADLVVRVLDAQGEILTQSDILYNARHIEEINLVLGGGVIQESSEYEQLITELTPLLDGLNFAELEESDEHQDISFLSGETGQDPQRIGALVTAYRFENLARNLIGNDTGDSFNLTAPVFYGLFREGMPADLHALLSQDQEILNRTLLKALADNVIPSGIEEKLELILDQLQNLVPIVTIQIPIQMGSSTLPALLNTVIENPELQQAFVSLYVANVGTIEEFWQGLEETEFQPSVHELQLTLQLGVLTGNYLPLVQHIKQLDSVSTLRDLAGLELDVWKGMIETYGFPSDVPGKDDEEKANNYAQTIYRMIEDAFPTAVVAHKLHGDEEFEMPFREEISNFLLSTPEFEFASSQIDAYFDANPGAFTGVEEIRQLKTMGRLFRVSPRFERYEAIKVLIENGFNSAQSIAMMGQRNFSSQYAEKLGNYHKAKAIYTHAAQMTAMTLTVHAKYSYAFNQPGMYVLPDIAKKMQEVPDWKTLFGSFTLCDCEHCQSVLSTSAYLVDLLAFLKKNNLQRQLPESDNETCSALDVLTRRRPEIEHINLSCINTDTLIPYVDLANEALENAVAYLPIPYTVDSQGFYQTTCTAEELVANPEHLNVNAYKILASAIYPWNQPFDLWIEEARTYLNHLGVSRYNLMETFRRNGENPTPSNLALASEYLGLTTIEQEIITDSSPSEPWLYWGLQEVDTIPDPTDPGELISGNWFELLCRIPVFLEKSGLSYEELDELLNTRFVNPSRFVPEGYQPEIKIFFEDSFCNVASATITNLNPEVLNKIHRFVRLWHKIGWTAKELDIVLNILITPYLGSPEIDESFLLKLWYFHQLHRALKIAIVNLLSFWSLISTNCYKGQIKSFYDQLFLNKIALSPEDQIFTLNTQRDELENPNEQISGHAEGIQAALEINNDALTLLLGLEWLFNHSWSVETQTSLNNGVVPEVLLQRFAEHNIHLSENCEVSVVEQDRKWIIVDNELKFTIRKDEKKNKFLIYKICEPEVDDLLNLANLSHLFRIVTLSKALKLSIGEFLSVKKLTGIDPFLDPYDPRNLEATLQFIEKVQKIRDSDFSVSELDYLLRQVYRESEGIAPLDDEIALVLDEIRDELQKIAKENSMAPDPDGEITATKLAWLKWDESLIQNVIRTLKGKMEFETPLDSLPDENFEFPAELKDKIFYDGVNTKLHWKGLMSDDEKSHLLVLSEEDTYQNAIIELFEQAKAIKTFIADRMKAFVLPHFFEELDSFPPEVIIPDEMKEKFYYDVDKKGLFFIGWMTETEKNTLIHKAPEDFCNAVDHLYDAPFHYIPDEENQFLKEEDVSTLLEASNIADRFKSILEILLPYIQNTQSTNLVIQKIADVLKLEAKVTAKLLTHYVILPVDYDSGKKAIDILLSPAFTQSNPNVNLTLSAFPEQFNAYVLLHKIALIMTKLRVTVDDIPLLFQKNPEEVWDERGWADLNFLPLIIQKDSAALFRAAEKLFDLFSFRDHLLTGKPTLFEILDMAFNPNGNTLEAFLKVLSERMGWNLEYFQQLAGWFGFDLVDFQHTESLVKLMSCFNVLKRLGVSAEKVCDWIRIPEEFDEAMDKAYQTARSIKQVAKAKYDNERWLVVAKPLRDDLREKQRSALVSYLITHYAFLDKTFKDSNDLYTHFLIDPEMSPCMMTSRLKLATSTVQLFVQRCLMNLEEWTIPNATIAQEWSSQWEWMKNYRVWEANRKVFLYPENWIEPELRDDKSPFFKDLESELLQNEVTSEHVEKVFLNYIEKLDAVARLEICGMYHEVEKEAPGGIGSNAVDMIHVFGRTRSIPHIYYYRRRIATGDKTIYWTPWEKVDLDIEGDHLIPVVWNRRLYLFWPIFTEKEIFEWHESTGSDQPGVRKEQECWSIQIAWSEYRNGIWSPKNVSKEIIDFSIVFPDIYDFVAPFMIPKNRIFFKTHVNGSYLVIICYVVFPYWGGRTAFVVASFRITGCFDGIMVDYHTYQDDDGTSNYPIRDIYPPLGSHVESMTFRENPGSRHLFGLTTDNLNTIVLFYETSEDYKILPPHQNPYFLSQDSFFYQDDTRTFFVTPHGTGVSNPQNPPDIDYLDQGDLPQWYNPEKVQPEQAESFLPDYYEFIPQYEHWEEMFPPDFEIDPPIIVTTFPACSYDETVGQLPDYGFYGTSARAKTRGCGRTNTLTLMSENTSMAMAHTSMATPVSEKTYRFEMFYHPYVCEFVKHLNREGIDGLLQRPVQFLNSLDFFEDTYLPTDIVDKPYPYEDIDFESNGAYSLYNWEIFFPYTADGRRSLEQEPTLRGGPEMVPLHLRSHRYFYS